MRRKRRDHPPRPARVVAPPARSLALAYCAALAAAACGPAPDEADRFATPATVALPPDTLDLGQNLVRLHSLLGEAREAEGEALFARVLDAEAITDRLLETAPPVEWLPEQYSVDATLRQFQAAADRIVARLRRGATIREVDEELAELAASVAHLSQVLEEGTGTVAPPDLDSLLADSAAARRSPVEVFGGVRAAPTAPARADTAPPRLLGASADSTRP